MVNAIKCITFGDMISLVEQRANIAGTVQERDRDVIKGYINEYNHLISTERDWYWRKMDRDFVFNPPLNDNTQTVSVTNGSREIIFSSAILNNTFIGRTFQVNGTEELYRIIGIDAGTNTAYLSTYYVETTNAVATYQIFQYEFPLPPDCDDAVQMTIDIGFGSPQEIEAISPAEFNRLMVNQQNFASVPLAWTRDGKINFESYPPLDVMLLDYDFLAGELYQQVDRIRIWPIQPDKSRVIHLNYSLQVEELQADTDEPLMPRDNRWVLVHFALAEWHTKNGSTSLADFEFAKAKSILKEMRSEHIQGTEKKKIIIRKSRYVRMHYLNVSPLEDEFLAARQAET
jgi:hypothetical protein